MLVLNPGVVKFGAETWEGVSALAVSRKATREVISWSDGGAHATFADVAEQSVRVKVTQDVSRGDVGAPKPGELGTLVFFTAGAAGDAGRKKASATAVVLSAVYELGSGGAERTVELVLVSSDGSTDPITITDASGGEA